MWENSFQQEKACFGGTYFWWKLDGFRAQSEHFRAPPLRLNFKNLKMSTKIVFL